MQKVTAYLLEQRGGFDGAESRISEGERVRKAIEAWLQAKGAEGNTESGTYEAEDGRTARWKVERAVDGDRSWSMHRLDEISTDDHRFSTSLSVTVGFKTTVLYVTLEVGSVSTQVSPIEMDPRCPKVVHDLLRLPESFWHHRGSQLRGLTQVRGFSEGEILAQDIVNQDRTVPNIVVSMVSDHLALQGLDDRLAYDLAGLANVFVIDEDASWALTDTLRKPLSCYSCAVRVYWPQFDLNDDPYRHPLWTEAKLKSLKSNSSTARHLFRRQMRRMVMRASAVSVIRPREIDEIRNAATRTEFTRIKARAKSLEDFQALADSYAHDNDGLRAELLCREEEIADTQKRLAELEFETRSLKFHLRQAKPEISDGVNDEDVEPDAIPDNTIVAPAGDGEVRFYKKKYGALRHDVMVYVGDCRHNSWQGAAKAEKAKKGIAKLEGSGDWNTIQRCGRCEGGGMWRVRW